MAGLTVLDLLLIALVLLAAAGGFRRSGGAERTGRLIGLLFGAAIALPLAALFAPAGASPLTQGLLRLAGLALGLLIGVWAGGVVGRLVSRGLVRGRLGLVDRVLGAVAAAGTTVLVLWVLATAVPLVVGADTLAPVTAALQPLGGHSQLLDEVGNRLPLPQQALDQAASTVAAT
ncbi:CvpA family protein [Pseudonocardia asaccharolytica]|uniref:CvpA family protein n=1 Tax=Pseudonocardia asaccharolytica TaxID=54010 RepID=UPI0003F4E650|nr:CvpA family protein [Pseudonocardia asaccharolytica]